MSILPDWLTGYDSANADAAAAADAQLQQLNAKDYAPGGSAYDAVLAQQGQPAADALLNTVATDYSTQAPIGTDAQRASIDQAFTDSLANSAKNIVGTPLGILWAEIKALLKAVPWWVWIIILIVPFAWLGGFGFLSRKARKKFAQ